MPSFEAHSRVPSESPDDHPFLTRAQAKPQKQSTILALPFITSVIIPSHLHMKSLLSKRQRQSLALVCILALAAYQCLTPGIDGMEVQRSLRTSKCSSHFPLRCIHEPPDKWDAVLFWHIPKSGGTSAKKLYQCMVRTIVLL